MMEDRMESRREVIKKVAYVAPVVLSLAASPAFAQTGSGEPPKPLRADPAPSGRQTRRIG